MKNAEGVSIISNQLKYLNKDESVSRRFILSKLRENTKDLLTKKLSDRSLYREDSLYSWVECLQMEKIDTIKCDIIEFKNCSNLMRSVKKLPDMIYSKYGAGLSKAYTIDGEKEYEYITLQQYNLNKKRSHNNKKYFYIKNNHLYLPDSTTERVNISILTLETEKLYDLNSCNPTPCKSIWEEEMIGSDRLQKAVIDITIQELASTNRQILEDQNPNLDASQKTSTTP